MIGTCYNAQVTCSHLAIHSAPITPPTIRLPSGMTLVEHPFEQSVWVTQDAVAVINPINLLHVEHKVS